MKHSFIKAASAFLVAITLLTFSLSSSTMAEREKARAVGVSAANPGTMSLSPEGNKAAFVNDKGELYIIDLMTMDTRKVDRVNAMQAKLSWSEKGDKLYLLQTGQTKRAVRLNSAADPTAKLPETIKN